MRESSIRTCEAHLDVAADVAIKACSAAASAAAEACTIPSSNLPTDTNAGRVTDSGIPTDNCDGIKTPMVAQGKTENCGHSLAKGALFRSVCLLAAQGLIDPAAGPRSAGASLAISVFSLRSLHEQDNAKTVANNETVVADGLVANGAGVALNTVTEDPKNSNCGAEGEEAPTADGVGGSDPPSRLGDNGNQNVATSKVAVELRDVRWGLELLLACVAPYLANGELEEEPETWSVAPTGKVKNGFAEEERVATVAGSEYVTQQTNGTELCDTFNNSNAGRAASSEEKQEFNDGTENVLPKEQPNDGDSGAQIACGLVDFACRCAHVGPALVASILAGWVPHLLQWGRSPSLSAVATNCPHKKGTGPREGQRVVEQKQPFKRPKTQLAHTGRVNSKDVCWSCGPAGEAAASEALASGAINMLVFMVRRFPLLPLSDFSAETLASAAEGGMAFGDRSPGGSTGLGSVIPNCTAKNKRQGRWWTNGQAQRAGETLMLDLFLARGGGGLEVLLPALNSARGIAYLSETSAALRSRDNLDKTSVHTGGDTESELENNGARKRVENDGSGGRKMPALIRSRSDRPFIIGSRERVEQKVEVRQRLNMQPSEMSSRQLVAPVSGSALNSATPEKMQSEEGKMTAHQGANEEVLDSCQVLAESDVLEKSVAALGESVTDKDTSNCRPVMNDKPETAPQEEPLVVEHGALLPEPINSLLGTPPAATGKTNKIFPLASVATSTESKISKDDEFSQPALDATDSRGAASGNENSRRTKAPNAANLSPVSGSGEKANAEDNVGGTSVADPVVVGQGEAAEAVKGKSGKAISGGWMSKIFGKWK